MKFFAVIPALLAAAAGEAGLPIHGSVLPHAGLYSGHAIAAPYAAAYNDARFAYGVPVTAYNARLTSAPVIDAPVAVAAPAHVAGYASAPVAVAQYAHAAPIAGPVSSQFQAQDEFGNIAFGYQNINSARQEEGNTYGGVTGSYSFVDEAGHHTVNYVADDLGFRVVASNLPVAPIHAAAAPVAVADTPAVAAAKAEFFTAYAAQQALSRKRRDIAYGHGYGLPALATGYAYPGSAHAGYAHAAHAAPATAAREATLTTIKLNPGHAVFYRVFEDTY